MCKIMPKDENKTLEKRPYLNPDICKNLREAVNSTPIFSHDKKYMAKYNLICAIMNRIDSCVNKLNTYSDYPDSEEDFIVFLTFGCMIVDAWKIISKELGIESINILRGITKLRTSITKMQKSQPTTNFLNTFAHWHSLIRLKPVARNFSKTERHNTRLGLVLTKACLFCAK